MQKNNFITLMFTLLALSVLLFSGCQIEGLTVEELPATEEIDKGNGQLDSHPLMKKQAVREAIAEVKARIEAGTMEYGTLQVSRPVTAVQLTPGGPISAVEGETVKLTATAPAGANLYIWRLYVDGVITPFFEMAMGPNKNSTVINIDKTNYGKGNYEVVCSVYVHLPPPAPGFLADLNSNKVAIDFTKVVVPPTLKEWAKFYRGVNWFQAIAPASDGGYAAVGYYNSKTTSTTAVIAKLDSKGNIVWSKELGGSKWDGLEKVITTADGNFVALGASNSLGDGNGDWLIKFDNTGKIIWQKYINSLPGNAFHAICETTSGELITVASGMYNELCITKMDSNGKVIWQKAGPRNEASITVGDLCATENGGFILAASTMGTTNKDYWILNFTANADIIWQKTYGGPQREWINSIHKTADGFIFGGDTKSFADKDDSMLIKIDKQGNIIWQKMLDIDQNYEGILALTADKNGGTLAAVSGTLINLDSTGALVSAQTYKTLFRKIINMPAGFTAIGYTEVLRLNNEGICGTYGTTRAVNIIDTTVSVKDTNMPPLVNESRTVSDVSGFYRDHKITAYQQYPTP